MEKIWYILIDEVEEGPFSSKELWFDARVNLETLVWKEGFRDWTPIKNVKELRKYFPSDSSSEKKDEKKDAKALGTQNEIALDYSNDPNFFFFLILVALLLLCFFLYRMH